MKYSGSRKTLVDPVVSNTLEVFRVGSTASNDPGNSAVRITAASFKFMLMGYDDTLNRGYIQAGQQGAAWQDVVINLNGGNVGIGTSSPAARTDIDQSSTTAAIPVLRLDQADISEEMISFETTIGVGNAIEAVGAKTLTTTHFIKVELPGALTRYIPVGTIA